MLLLCLAPLLPAPGEPLVSRYAEERRRLAAIRPWQVSCCCVSPCGMSPGVEAPSDGPRNDAAAAETTANNPDAEGGVLAGALASSSAVAGMHHAHGSSRPTCNSTDRQTP